MWSKLLDFRWQIKSDSRKNEEIIGQQQLYCGLFFFGLILEQGLADRRTILVDQFLFLEDEVDDWIFCTVFKFFWIGFLLPREVLVDQLKILDHKNLFASWNCFTITFKEYFYYQRCCSKFFGNFLGWSRWRFVLGKRTNDLKIPKHVCTKCSETFNSTYALRQHRMTHSKSFSCSWKGILCFFLNINKRKRPPTVN